MEESKNVPTNTPSYFIPGYPPLSASDDIGKAAVQGQVFEYPQVLRQAIDPPITAQLFGNISLMLFKEPKLSKHGHPIYGFLKLRGNYESDAVCRQKAYTLVREVDSKFQIRIAPVGSWVPITESESAVKELYDVRGSDQEVHLRDEAVKKRRRMRGRLLTNCAKRNNN